MRKNIYNANKLTLIYCEDNQQFELIRNNAEYGRKYTLSQAYDLRITINKEIEGGRYNGSFNIAPEVERRLNEYEQTETKKKGQNIESLVSSG